MTTFKKSTIRRQKIAVKTAKRRTTSSTDWLRRHLNDPYVIMAKDNAYRSRAAFKLLQIDQKFKIFSGAKVVVDIGCAPGGWLQVAREKTRNAKVIGLDLQAVDPIPDVDTFQGDIYDDNLISQILALIPHKIDIVLSDMACSATGNKQLDHLRNISLVEAAMDFAKNNLKPNGVFVAKVLRGGEEVQLMKDLRLFFKTVKQFKPDASYSDSSEIYFVCLGYKD